MKYFAYGSNMHVQRFRRRVHSGKPLCVGSLEKHALRFHKKGTDGSGKCNAFYTGEAADRVLGIIYEMAPEEKTALDAAEGPGYRVHNTAVNGMDGTRHEAFIYVACSDAIDDSQKPFCWYKAFVVHGARHFKLPPYYIQQLETVSAIPDTDTRRESQNRRILES